MAGSLNTKEILCFLICFVVAIIISEGNSQDILYDDEPKINTPEAIDVKKYFDFVKSLEVPQFQLCNSSIVTEDANSTNTDDEEGEGQGWNFIQLIRISIAGSSYNFTFNPDHLQKDWCKTKTFEANLTLDNEFLPRENQSEKTQDIYLHPNGTLTVTTSKIPNTSYGLKDYCVDLNDELQNNGSITITELRFEICQPPCIEHPCIKKCCKENEVMDTSTHHCVPSSPLWRPTFYREPNKKDGVTVKRNYSLRFEKTPKEALNCTETYIIESNLDLKFPNLLPNGTLVLMDPIKKTSISIPSGEFCIDGIYEGNGSSSLANGTTVTYSESEWNQMVIICSPDKQEIPTWIPPLYAFVNHTAAFFLFLTAMVYLILWSQQNIHGWLQFSYAVSLFFAFSFLAVVQTWSQEIHGVSKRLCAYLGWLIHFTFLSAFFWLTSMNFDLWWRFSGRRSLRRSRARPYRENVKRFIQFALFSLGFPVLFSGSAVVLDHIYEGSPGEAWLKIPNFGKQKCYFEDKKSQFPFLYGPVGVLLLINLIFFSSTVMHLKKIHTNTELARAHRTLEDNDKNGVRLIAKLFIVMGVLWIFEFISWAANVLFPNSEILLIWVFLPTDILQSLQGIAIFVIFIWKPNVFAQLKAKLQGIINNNETFVSTGTKHEKRAAAATASRNDVYHDWCFNTDWSWY